MSGAFQFPQPEVSGLSPSNIEARELEQDIDQLRSSIAALEASRSRLGDLASSASSSASDPGAFWGDLAEVVEDFFAVAAETLGKEAEEVGGEVEGEEGEEGEEEEALAPPKRRAGPAIESGGALSTAVDRLKRRIAQDLRLETEPVSASPELAAVVSELDSEIAGLNSELQAKLDRLNSLSDADDDINPPAPVVPEPVQPDDHTIHPPHDVTVTDDVVVNPVDVLPDVVVNPVVIDPVVVHPVVVDPVVVDPVTPVVDVIPSDDTPAYTPGQQEEIGELDGAVYDINDILKGGRSVADLRRYDVPAGVVRDAGVPVSDMISGGYTLAELHEAGCPASDLHGLASSDDLRAAGYSASELHGVFSLSECVTAYSPHELHDAGFDLAEFHGVVPLAALTDIFPLSELRTSYSAAELRDAGLHAADLATAGFGWDELAAAGFTLSDLESAGASEDVLRGIFPADFPTGSEEESSSQFRSF